MTSGTNTAASASMSAGFAIIEPSVVPTAMSTTPEKADIRETVSSGRVVEKATSVRPIMKLDTPRRRAVWEAYFTTMSAPFIRRANPIASNKR